MKSVPSKFKCVENNMNNGNFTLGKVYEVNDGGSTITCDFIRLRLPKDLVKVSTVKFEFAFCKFSKI